MMSPVSIALQFVFVAAVGGSYCVSDNKGKEFVIGYMEELENNPHPLGLYVTGYDEGVTIDVTAPKYENTIVIDTEEVFNSQATKVELSRELQATGSKKENKGILVTATGEVTVYGYNQHDFSNDAFLALPVEGLGMEYYTVSHHPSWTECEFLVVATEDATEVTITLGSHKDIRVDCDFSTYKSNQVIHLELDAYQTFQAQTTGDLSGSHIEATKKVAVFTGNKQTYVGGELTQDHLVEQVPPVTTWGKRFATVPTPERTDGDKFRFVTSKDNTAVTVTCALETNNFILNTGTAAELDIPSNECCYVTSTEPILVAQIMKSQVNSSSEPGDPSMMLLTHLEQFSADFTFVFPTSSRHDKLYDNFFMFVIKDCEKEGLRVDGNPIETTYLEIPTTDYVGGYVKFTSGEGTHTVTHTSQYATYAGYIYGKTTVESYAMSIGMRLTKIN